MTLRRVMLAVAAILLVAGVIALMVPVSVSGSNGSGVGCGNAVSEDLTSARSADNGTGANIPILSQLIPHSDYVGQCESAVSSRRSWSIPLVVVGALALVGSFVVPRRAIGTR